MTELGRLDPVRVNKYVAELKATIETLKAEKFSAEAEAGEQICRNSQLQMRLLRRMKQVAELEKLRENDNRVIAMLESKVKEAYEGGWQDGRNTSSVTGDPEQDWEESETKLNLLTEKGEKNGT